jgi:hypothetical protein
VLGAVFLIFSSGLAVGAFKLPPYELARETYRAAKAGARWVGLRSAERAPVLWKTDRDQGSGLVQYQRDKAFKGYTLYSSGHAQKVMLLDMEGEVVHRWDFSFREVWPSSPHIPIPSPPQHIYVRRAHVYPDGELLACFVSASDTPYGYGLARFDASGKLLWKYNGHTHHDFDVAKDGTIYALTHDLRDRPPQKLSSLPSNVLEDFIVTLTPDGEVKQKVSVLDAMLNSKYSEALKRRISHEDNQWDLLHTNSVTRVNSAFASADPAIEPGQVMVLMRNLNLLAVVDLEKEAVTWGMTGPWHLPHDPQLLANGHISLFDNQVLHGPMRGSRVIEFDPRDSQIVWEYRGSKEKPFLSATMSRHQILPNDNVLIVEAHGGRMFEVTREGEIAWSYVNPVRAGAKEQKIPIIADAVRYDAEQLPFLNNGSSEAVRAAQAGRE